MKRLSKSALTVLHNISNEYGADFYEEYEQHGICCDCGHVQDSVEPDAEGYTCCDCGEPSVVGMFTAVLLQ